jgi:cytochrome c biogenesis protein CcmG/thiol:disulfide interchange protein DsbE
VASRLKLGAQGLAVAAVLGLLALLVWKIVQDDGGAAAKLRSGEHPVAPGFTLDRLDRSGALTLDSLRGKAVVINFWASWCRPCKEEAPLLQAAWRRLRSQGVVILGIDSEDASSKAREFLRKNGITYPNVRDGSGRLARDAYGLTGYPETFFVAPDGRIVHHIAGQIHDEADLEDGVEAARAT